MSIHSSLFPARRALALGLATALAGSATLAVAAPTHPAATQVVSHCLDDGSAGSLRSVIAAAANGDLIDLSALTCSTISLAQGQLVSNVNSLTLRGPATPLTIDAHGASGMFAHYGSDTLRFEHLSLVNGTYAGGGACVFSQGNVELDHVTVSGCSAAESAGGGVLALKNLTLESSTLSGNSALVGGAAAANGAILVRNSTISGNSAEAIGGGLYSGGHAQAGASVTIQNSTISGNEAGAAGGGLYLGYDAALSIGSTIIASNVAPAGYGADIGSADAISIAGSHNIILDSTLTVPGDTIALDPLLQPLADNGGPTRTHAMAMDSPAFDAGSNIGSFEFDQRGTGFARSVGVTTDIGAFEFQDVPDDTIFDNGFES